MSLYKHEYNGQIFQDKFVVTVLKNKPNGFFLEIGSNHPKNINNSYVLEKELNWNGIMIEYDEIFKPMYEEMRPNSTHVINDATKIDYVQLLKDTNAPSNIDYLQIDLEVSNRSTLTTLEILDNTVFDNYKFAIITFEHDIYTGDYFNTRQASREILLRRGYVLVFPDVTNYPCPFEDWYVHPDLVDMNFVNKIKTERQLIYQQIMTIIDSNC